MPRLSFDKSFGLRLCSSFQLLKQSTALLGLINWYIKYRGNHSNYSGKWQ
jgi:hypothetical protein